MGKVAPMPLVIGVIPVHEGEHDRCIENDQFSPNPVFARYSFPRLSAYENFTVRLALTPCGRKNGRIMG